MFKYTLFLYIILLSICCPKHIEAKYPNGPISIIVPSRAGGSAETTANLFIKYAKKYWPTAEFTIKIVPENSGRQGFEEIAKAEPDGQTIGIVFTTQIINHIITKQGDYTLKSFYYLGNIEIDPEIVVVPRESPINNLKDLANMAKYKKLSVAINGFGSDDFIALKEFEEMTNTSMTLMPTKASTEQRTAIMSGQVDLSFMNLSQMYAQHKAGQVKIIAILSKKRDPLIPNIPTGEEEGFPIYMEYTRGLIAPSKIGPDIQKKLSELFANIIMNPRFAEDCKKENIYLVPMDGKKYYHYLQNLQKTIQKLYNKAPW